jgi:hypothetical protein
MNACDLIQHIGSGEEFVVARDQRAIMPFHNEHTVYAWDRAGQRIPLDRRFVRVVVDTEAATPHSALRTPHSTPEASR